MKAVAMVALTALALAGLAVAAAQKEVFKLSAGLKASSEVPKPTDVRAGAAGTFTGFATSIPGNVRVRLTWSLTFSKLSGRAAAAHIHVGRPGKAGNVMVALCGPCKSGQKGSARITNTQLKTIRAGGAYVNIHTAKNAAGEIRGQVKAVKTASAPNPPPSPPPPPPPAPEPPPYP